MGSFTRYCNYSGGLQEPDSGIARVLQASEDPVEHGPLIRHCPLLSDRILLQDNVKLESISCELCQQIFEEPTVAGMCGHCFCKPCLLIYKSTKSTQGCPTCKATITKFSGLPNRSLAAIIDSQKRFCVSRYVFDCATKTYVEMEDGCTFSGTSEEMAEHEQSCELTPIECPRSSCKRVLLRRDLEEHSRTECWTHCEQCWLDVQICNQEQHRKEECPETKCPCPRSDLGCCIVLKRKSLGKHLETCPYERYRNEVEQLRKSLKEKDDEIALLRGNVDASKIDTSVNERKREPDSVLFDVATPSKKVKREEWQEWATGEVEERVAVSPDSVAQPGVLQGVLAQSVAAIERALMSRLELISTRVDECGAKVAALEEGARQRRTARRSVPKADAVRKTGSRSTREKSAVGEESAERKNRREGPVGARKGDSTNAAERPVGRMINLRKSRTGEGDKADVKGKPKLPSRSPLKESKKESMPVGQESSKAGGSRSQLREVKRERSPSVTGGCGGRASVEPMGSAGRRSDRTAERGSEHRHRQSERASQKPDRHSESHVERREERPPTGYRVLERRVPERPPGRESVERTQDRREKLPGRPSSDRPPERSTSTSVHVSGAEVGDVASPTVERDVPCHPTIRCLSFWFRSIDLVSKLLSNPTPQQGRFISTVVSILRDMQQAADFRALFQPSSNVAMLEALRQLDERVQCLIDGRVDYSSEANHAWKMAMDSVPAGVLVYDNWSLIKLERFVWNKTGGMKYESRFNVELKRAIEVEKQKPDLSFQKIVLLNSGEASPDGSDSQPPGFPQDRPPPPPPQRALADRIGPRPNGRHDSPERIPPRPNGYFEPADRIGPRVNGHFDALDRPFRRPREPSPPPPAFRASVRDRSLDPRDTRRHSDAGSSFSQRSPRYSVFDADM